VHNSVPSQYLPSDYVLDVPSGVYVLRIRDIASSVYVRNIYHMRIVMLQVTKNSFLFRKISLFIK